MRWRCFTALLLGVIILTACNNEVQKNEMITNNEPIEKKEMFQNPEIINGKSIHRLGNTHKFDGRFGTYLLTVEDVKAYKKIEGVLPIANKLHLVATVTIKNISFDPIDLNQIVYQNSYLHSSNLDNIRIRPDSNYFSNIRTFEDHLDYGEETTGDLVFQFMLDSDTYQISFSDKDSVVYWSFSSEDIQVFDELF